MPQRVQIQVFCQRVVSLQVADAGQCGQRLCVAGLQGQRPLGQARGRRQFVLLNGPVCLPQKAPEPGRLL